MSNKKRVFKWDQSRAWWFDTATGEPISDGAKIEPPNQLNPTPPKEQTK